MQGGQGLFQWYEYIAALFIPFIGTTNMIKVEAWTNFTKQALLDGAKTIQALNEEQIQMRKVVIQNRMALDMLTAAQEGTCAIINIECFHLTLLLPGFSCHLKQLIHCQINQQYIHNIQC